MVLLSNGKILFETEVALDGIEFSGPDLSKTGRLVAAEASNHNMHYFGSTVNFSV